MLYDMARAAKAAAMPEGATVVGPVEPGSLVLLSESVLPKGMTEEQTDAWLGDATRQIELACGHGRFVIMVMPKEGGRCQVFGPKDLEEALARR